MNKESFLALLKDSTRAGSEINSLVALSKEHPYSQPVRAMLAKGSKRGNTKNYQNRITVAAVYAADRTVLKEFIEKGSSISEKGKNSAPVAHKQSSKSTVQKVEKQQKTETKSAPAPVAKPKQEVPVKAKTAATTVSVDNIADLREEVLYNLQELIKNKQALNDIIGATPAKTAAKASAKSPAKKKTVAKPKSTNKQEKSKVKTSPTTQKKSKVQSSTVKEELISKFIETSPSITPNKKFSGTQEDLSLKSVVFNEDFVSENLAEIFARQGKVKKAIEIYRKLIWKFPQKKAFFATRIEEFKTK